MPSSLTINRYANEAEQGSFGKIAGYLFDTIQSRLFVFIEANEEVLTFIKLRPALIIASTAARRILNK